MSSSKRHFNSPPAIPARISKHMRVQFIKAEDWKKMPHKDKPYQLMRIWRAVRRMSRHGGNFNEHHEYWMPLSRHGLIKEVHED